MGFVYEEVGKENRELWESIGWKNWGKDLIDFLETRHWSIDRENGFYMQPIGGGFRDLPYYYDFAYKNRIVRMEVAVKSNGDKVNGFNIIWSIYRILVPKSIWKDKDKILEQIKASFLVCTGGILDNKINSITTEICCEAECTEVDYNGR